MSQEAPLGERESKYVRYAFFADVLEPWCQMEGSEWGEVTAALHRALDGGSESILPDELCEAIVAFLFSDIQRGLEEGWLEDEYADEIAVAREGYAEVMAHWDARSKEFNLPASDGFPGQDAHDTFLRAERDVPDWAKLHDPDAARQRKAQQLRDAIAQLDERRGRFEEELAELESRG